MSRKTSVVCFVVTVLCALCTTVQARLGETREQCDKRYGKVVYVHQWPNGLESVKYEINGLVVHCEFYKDKVDMILFNTKINRDLLDIQKAIDLLKINAEGATWSKQYQDGTHTRWVRSDAGFASFWMTDSNAYLNIYSSSRDLSLLDRLGDDQDTQHMRESLLRLITVRKAKYKLLLEEGGISGF